MTRPWGVVWIALTPLLLGAGPPVVKSAAPAPDLDALFEQADGWIGGDGAYSVVLSPKRILCALCGGPHNAHSVAQRVMWR